VPEALRLAAAEVPCALLALAPAEGGLAVSGHARPGPDLDAFLRRAREEGRAVQSAVEPIAPALCAPIPVLAAAVRQEGESGSLRLLLAEGGTAVGGRLAATLQGRGGGMLQVDLHTQDGMVHHVMRRPLPSGQWSIQLQATIPGPPGQQMLVAIATATPLDLAARPAREPASEYLPALQREMERTAQAAATAPRAEVVFLQAIPALPGAAAPAAQRR
jgi:hypothetical protein